MCGDFKISIYELVSRHAFGSRVFSVLLNCSIIVIVNCCFEFLSENFNSIHAYCTFGKTHALF